MAIPTPFAEKVLAHVRTLVDPLLVARRVELVELTYRREGPQTVLRFLVDTAAGITVQECTALNQAIGALLDEHEVMTDPYCLEVSSPGLDRFLKTTWDFERVIGRRVKIHLRAPVDGLWEVIGVVASVGDELITIELDQGTRVRVPLLEMTSARQDVTFR